MQAHVARDFFRVLMHDDRHGRPSVAGVPMDAFAGDLTTHGNFQYIAFSRIDSPFAKTGYWTSSVRKLFLRYQCSFADLGIVLFPLDDEDDAYELEQLALSRLGKYRLGRSEMLKLCSPQDMLTTMCHISSTCGKQPVFYTKPTRSRRDEHVAFSPDLLLTVAEYDELSAKERVGGLTYRQRQQLHVSREAFTWGLARDRFDARFHDAFLCMFDDDDVCRELEEKRNRFVAAAHAVANTAQQLSARYGAAAATARGSVRKQNAFNVFKANAARLWLPGLEAVRLLDAAKPAWREEARRAPAHTFHLTAEEITAGFDRWLEPMDRGSFGSLCLLLGMKKKDKRGRDRFDLVGGRVAGATAAAAAEGEGEAEGEAEGGSSAATQATQATQGDDGAGTSAAGAADAAAAPEPRGDNADSPLNRRTAFLRGFLMAALAVEVKSDRGASKSHAIVGRHRVSFKPLYDVVAAHEPGLLADIMQPVTFVEDD